MIHCCVPIRRLCQYSHLWWTPEPSQQRTHITRLRMQWMRRGMVQTREEYLRARSLFLQIIARGDARSIVALPPSGAARSQVDQERDAVTTKLNYKIDHSATFKDTKMFIPPLQPSCDAQDTAICRQVNQMGHTSEQA